MLPVRVDVDRLAAEVLLAMLLQALLEVLLELIVIDQHATLHGAVPVVLDAVVGTALENVGDVGPLVRLVPVQQEQNPLFLTAPSGRSLDHRVQVVVPALSALLTDTAG